MRTKIMSLILAITLMFSTATTSLAYVNNVKPIVYVNDGMSAEDLNLDFYYGNQGSYISVDSLVKSLQDKYSSEQWKYKWNSKTKEIAIDNDILKAVFKINECYVPVYDKMTKQTYLSAYNKELCGFEMYPQVIQGKPYIPTKYLNALGFGVVYDPENFSLSLMNYRYMPVDTKSPAMFQNDYGYDESNINGYRYDPYVDFLGYPLNWSETFFNFDEFELDDNTQDYEVDNYGNIYTEEAVG